MSAARRLAELDAERDRILEEQRTEALLHDRTRRISLEKLASDMGVKLRPLKEAACSGRLKAWRVGGSVRGELVTTREALDAYLDSQPAATDSPAAEVVLASPADQAYENAVKRMGRRRGA